ncbi:hypothetical protein B0H14DRAFT_3453293 [Mycena olivaceomarginata]|nr:hypothetical protein B0H14DRAFT_3453293 [Mycena olivaceomarginata]
MCTDHQWREAHARGGNMAEDAEPMYTSVTCTGKTPVDELAPINTELMSVYVVNDPLLVVPPEKKSPLL